MTMTVHEDVCTRADDHDDEEGPTMMAVLIMYGYDAESDNYDVC